MRRTAQWLAQWLERVSVRRWLPFSSFLGFVTLLTFFVWALAPIAASTLWWSALGAEGSADAGVRSRGGPSTAFASSPHSGVSEGVLASRSSAGQATGAGGSVAHPDTLPRGIPARPGTRSRALPVRSREPASGTAFGFAELASRDEALSLPLTFSEVGRDRRGLLAHARGRDLAAPRELGLFRVSLAGGATALIARARSSPDGSFAFERLLVSPSRVDLVVAALSEAPGEASASGIASLAALPLQPPAVTAGELDEIAQTWRLRVHAASGSLLAVDDPAGASRRPLSLPARFAAQRNPGLRVDAPRGDTLWLSQQAPDGRRSRWVAVGRAAPTADALASESDRPSEGDAAAGLPRSRAPRLRRHSEVYP